MKALVVHNYYQIAGGEDHVFNNEVKLLNEFKSDSIPFDFNNKNINTFSSKIRVSLSLLYSYDSFKRIICKINKTTPDIVHVHNYFPLISPSVFYACKRKGIPVVHTLHNFRAICPTALLMYGGKINENSINNSPWWTVRKKVYKNSFFGTLFLSLMVFTHKKIGTWNKRVDRYIALTNFAKEKYIEAGWPAEKIVVKPNFIEDPFKSVFEYKNENYAIYIGRLSEEKGIDILLNSWSKKNQKLLIVGDGPLRKNVESCENSNVVYLGKKEKEEVLELVHNASFLIMASTWYEGFPMVLVEAMACGTAAIVPDLGGMGEIVKDGTTGLHFEPGSTADLSRKVDQLFNSSEEQKRMGLNARNEYLEKYTPEKNYEMLIDIYQQAIEEARRKL